MPSQKWRMPCVNVVLYPLLSIPSRAGYRQLSEHLPESPYKYGGQEQADSLFRDKLIKS
ncbi:MAG: hypothetical protein ABII06_01170 [Pseudomonadota bacterium]